MSTGARTNVGDNSLSLMRATLRAPPSKWAIEAFFRRVSAANCPEGKRGPSGALGAAQSDPQGGWEASRATGRELCDTGHPVLEDSPEGATAGRSPRPREAEGRLAPEMAESHEARSQAQAQRRAWSQCIATWAASGVAVLPAFFGTFFRVERKYCPPRGGSPIRPRRSRRVSPTGEGFFYSKVAVRYCKQGAFRSPFGNLRAPKVARNP